MKSSTQRWDQGLYLVPTPIGNLADMSYRAVDVLSQVDVIFCEDTRTTKKLCAYYDIATPLKAYHDHSDSHIRKSITDKLLSGQSVALVSDAGTPLISDPGYKLVRECIALNVRVIPLPGANAVLPALQMAGFPTDRFMFGGFLPHKTQERQSLLQDVLQRYADMTLSFYESPKRLLACLHDIAQIDPQRDVCVCREISKLHEEALRGKAGDIAPTLEERGAVKGEIVIVINAAAEQRDMAPSPELVHIVQSCMEAMGIKEASHKLAAITGMSKKDIYDLGLKIKDGHFDA